MADFPNAPDRSGDPASPSRPLPRRARWPWLVALLLILAAVGWWWWHGRTTQEAAPGATGASRASGARGPRAPGAGGPPGAAGAGAFATPPIPVKAEAARSENLDVFIKSLGTVTSFNTVTVRSRVDGELMKVLFKEGQRVKAGDLIAQIDPRAYQVALSQAQGTLQQNQAQLENARKDLDRYQTLFSQDSIARQQVDTQAALVRQYEGTLKTNQAAVDNARLQLDYTRVTAPIAGRVGLRQVDQGNLVRSSDTNGLVIITQTQPISVIFTIAESDLPRVLQQLRGGNRLAVEAYDRADLVKIADGVLDTLDNQIDVTTGTVKMKARFDNKDESLFPNQFVNARLHVRTLKDATVIPTAAVQRGTPGTFVYVVKPDNTIDVRVIKLGQPNGERVAVTEGLAPGEKVVVEGVDRLRAGAKVDVVTGAAEVPAAAGSQLQRSGEGGPRPNRGQTPRP
ncbi:MdtA/MuxA family multidrug efflux RND transporter periplasmic adaptor subunit [Pigmentiphaga litoralis]|uniref:MdtA/MuxA family multidrug efflux RND transporter periplasmic adaptor subunit n=1 Tax=Pigmentiphaga litoralis TaxID=516702 RepID=UPI003B431504